MNQRLSDKVRNAAKVGFVEPAVRAGSHEFSIPVSGLMKRLEADGFPRNHTPQICSAVQTKKFLEDNGLELVGIDGPASKVSTTVILHYRVKGNPKETVKPAAIPSPTSDEPSSERARRLIAQLRAEVKLDLTKYGGPEGFIRWVRGYDEEDR